MSLITPYQLNRFDLTQAEVDELINTLAISELEFSVRSSLYHRFFGVITGEAAGEITFIRDTASPNRSETPDKFLLNSCARFGWVRTADKIQSALEGHIGHTLSPRYLSEEQPFHSFDLPTPYLTGNYYGAPFLAPDWKFRTRYPGVEKMNVVPLWTTVAGYEEIDLNPFLQENLVAVAHTHDGIPVARIDDVLTQNPRDVILRKTANGAKIPTFIDDQHPLEHDVGTYWAIPIDTSISQFSIVSDRVTVQHRKYVKVDIPAPTLTTGQTLYPVFPDSNQIIPQAKPRTTYTIGDNVFWRYTFYVYTLVHHEFVAEDVNLVAGEFYKLYPFISFKAFQEIESLPSIVVTKGDEVVVVEPILTLTNSEHGVFHLNYDTCRDTDEFACLCQGWPQSATLRYTYKTNPDYLPLFYRNQIPVLREAAAGRIAAEMPTDDCGCEVPYGFIKEMQFTYTDAYINTQTQVVVEQLRFGTMKGQQNYAKALNSVTQYRPILLPRVKS